MGEDTRGAVGGGDSTASRLAATAATLFRTKGYAGSTTRELAALLGIQSASLYHHIGSKEDLLYALSMDALHRIQHEVERAIASETEPGARLRAMIRTHISSALADQDKHATMLIELRALSDARRAQVLGLRDAYETLVRDTIAGAQAAGALRRDVPAKHLALALLNLLNWSIFWFRPGGELTAERLGDLLATLYLEGTGRSAAPCERPT